MFDIVVAADLDWGIGKAGGLPWPKLRGDLAHFRRVTTTTRHPDGRNAIIMGRKTWHSQEVAGKPLPRRLNVVVSRGRVEVPDGVIAAGSLADALAACVDAGVESTFVVGGAGLFVDALTDRQLRHVYLTRIDGRFGCDVTMADLDARGFYRDATWDGETVGHEHDVHYRIERLCRPQAASASP